MRATFFQDNHLDPVPDMANGYVRRNGAWRVADSNLDTVGDGGLYSNVEDMLKWLINFDRQRVGGKAIHEIIAPAILNNGQRIEYGKGLSLHTLGGKPVVEHGGALAGYRIMDLWIPSEKFGVVVLCNNGTADVSNMAQQVARAFLGARLTPEQPVRPSAGYHPTLSDVRPLVGRYIAADGEVLTFLEKDKAVFEAQPLLKVYPADKKTYYLGRFGEGGKVVLGEGDGSQSLTVTRYDAPPMVFERISEIKLTEMDRRALVGDYHSSELNLIYHVINQGVDLAVAIGDSPPMALEPVGADRFLLEDAGAELDLSRDDKGQVTGFSVSTGRVKNVTFDRRL
jgi:hypothetical protein